MFEIWKPAFGFEKHYAVSNLGNVKRLKASCGTHKDKLIKPWPSTRNRPVLSLSVSCKITKIALNRLTCLTWHGKPPTPKHQAAHWDGNSWNNRVSNLRWATQAENEQDKKRHGRWNHAPSGSLHKDAKLHETDIPKIKNLKDKGWSSQKIAKHFKVDNSTICNILKGKTWKHVQS